MMLLLQINENSPKLLPLDNGEDCIQRVQLGYLYVTRILIIFIPYCIGHPLFHLLFDSRHACSRSDQTTYLLGVILCVESHAYIDEGNLVFNEVTGYLLPARSFVDAKEHERHRLQFAEVSFINMLRVCDYSPPHLGVDFFESTDLSWLFREFIVRRCSWTTKGIVLEEDVFVEQVNL